MRPDVLQRVIAHIEMACGEGRTQLIRDVRVMMIDEAIARTSLWSADRTQRYAPQISRSPGVVDALVAHKEWLLTQ